ncbi:EamA family transporter [Luteibacter sp. 22Crub2.1]|uniref:EamA family transporter n=1 Tax=Luteibacter sp. 22Crub2.1 TaxID=1283288 RepID=UPI0009A6D242|nr:EamA family transporter [Luteibacter sp. 22Crub2.1]SKC08241.1 O-acetylserine/cysteine efflux transporter [Luteibacter sp. 22Crub2.1]
MRVRDLMLGALVTVIWGSNFSVIEAGLRDLDPFLLTALRFLMTALPLAFFIRRPVDVPLSAVAIYGVLFGVGLWFVVNLAMSQGMSPGLSSLVLQFSAFFTLLLSAAVLGERIRAPQVAGMVLAGGGLLLVVGYTKGAAATRGVLLVLLAAVSWSVCNLIVKRHKPADMLAFIVWSSAFSAPALLLLTWLVRGSAPFVVLSHGITFPAVGSILFQAYVTTIFGYFIWNTLMKTYPAATVAPLSLLVPVSGIATSWLVFDEHFASGVWLGIAVMLAGVVVFVLSPRWTRAPVIANPVGER